MTSLACTIRCVTAQTVVPASTATTPPTASTSSSSHYLQITINPSTAHIIEGAVYGLDAELENTSSVPVTIDVEKMLLSVQPELAPPNISCTWFYNAVANDTVPSPMVLRPGDHFIVFFDTGSAVSDALLNKSPQCKTSLWGSLRRRLDFVPGNYAFVLTGVFSVPSVSGVVLCECLLPY
jgi:hypothetical protein